MPAESDAFVMEYLHEIGVHTPVSLQAHAASSARNTSPPLSASPEETSMLAELQQQSAECVRCNLCESRQQVVFGAGDPNAELVLIGEAPGRDEDAQGEPFVGMAGQLLNRMLQASGLQRESVYIMNTIKCRPPNNRDPKVEEIEACRYWFDAQLAALKPKRLVLLGRVAAQSVLRTDAPLASLRGRVHDVNGIPARVFYHPAYLLRSPAQKRVAWQDWCMLLRELKPVV